MWTIHLGRLLHLHWRLCVSLQSGVSSLSSCLTPGPGQFDQALCMIVLPSPQAEEQYSKSISWGLCMMSLFVVMPVVQHATGLRTCYGQQQKACGPISYFFMHAVERIPCQICYSFYFQRLYLRAYQRVVQWGGTVDYMSFRLSGFYMPVSFNAYRHYLRELTIQHLQTLGIIADPPT